MCFLGLLLSSRPSTLLPSLLSCLLLNTHTFSDHLGTDLEHLNVGKKKTEMVTNIGSLQLSLTDKQHANKCKIVSAYGDRT